MSIIEQAVRRLEELRRSGIEPPAAALGGAGNAPVVERLRSALPAADAAAGAIAGRTSAVPATKAHRPAPHHDVEARSSKLVRIDLDRLAAMEYLTPTIPRSKIADEFRVIKRPLLANVRAAEGTQDRANLIMVTSSLPGEGKTFVSVNLALSLAMELDKTVLLIDADVSRPSILDRLGLPQAPGLLDVLTDPAIGLGDVMLRTNIPKLSLLPAGRPHGQATELLSSEAMHRLLAEMSSRYADRILVFDAPPLLPSTESRVLATLMGQVILVVEASNTTQKTVEQALATVEQCPNVLPLLNKIGRSEVGSYYGYYNPVEG
ncbi:XrtA-associated tyrosine autokinase [uncultured Piscinibacter sp.]|uniref:XrtA-associated tyrosine autokinase n=1 Tax=uncultured Piscinibacter sp. TaxID=1131835 RepID=UPI0026205A25|nr:XrtA-associated tyrosine autokinase [uncultured Piscinibacter sp.]